MTATQALTDTGARSWLPAELRDWLDAHAQALDEGAEDPASVLPRLAEAGVFRLGVPASQGGLEGSDAGDAIEAVSQLAEHSVAAAFVAWGQRVFIEYLLHSPNQALARDWTGPLLRGELAGATALSNAMKFLSGIESLQISARQDGDDWVLDGRMPWVTNLRPDGFLVAAAVTAPDGTPAVVALPQGIAGLTRSADLRLLGLQSSNTAALEVKGVRISPRWLIHADARQYLPQARPAFAGLQCGLSRPGPARAAPGRDGGQGQGARGILAEPLAQLQAQVEYLSDQLIAGVREGRTWPSPGCCSRSASRWPRRRSRRCSWSCRPAAARPEAGRRWLRAALARGRLPAHRHAQPGAAEDRAGQAPRPAGRRGGGMSGDMSGRVPVLRARSDAALSGRRRRRVPGREPGPGARRGAGRAGRAAGRQVQPAARAGRAAGAQRRRARHGRPAAGRRASARGRGVPGSLPG